MNQVEYEKALARYINEAANLMKATQENMSGFPSQTGNSAITGYLGDDQFGQRDPKGAEGNNYAGIDDIDINSIIRTDPSNLLQGIVSPLNPRSDFNAFQQNLLIKTHVKANEAQQDAKIIKN